MREWIDDLIGFLLLLDPAYVERILVCDSLVVVILTDTLADDLVGGGDTLGEVDGFGVHLAILRRGASRSLQFVL